MIQRDPKEEVSEEKKLKRLAAEKEEEERHLSALNEQVRGEGDSSRGKESTGSELRITKHLEGIRGLNGLPLIRWNERERWRGLRRHQILHAC